jgi:chromosomal replication initiation ATPase DnaA
MEVRAEIQAAERQQPDLQEIKAVVARLFGLAPADLAGGARNARYVHARFTAYAVARDCGHSLSEIGHAFGGRDHTTVLSGLCRFDDLALHEDAMRLRHRAALAHLSDAKRRDAHAELRLQLIIRLMRAQPDELACVARFLGVAC